MPLARRQAIILWIVSIIGFLNGLVFITAEKDELRKVPMGTMMLVVAVAGFALGVWLWRKK